MSTEVVRLLPAGLERVVEKIVELGPTKFVQISRHILERMPDISDSASVLNSLEREKLLGSFENDSSLEFTVLLTISELWKNIAYHQLKLQPLLESLNKAGFDAKIRDAIVKIWSESGLTISNRLRDMSFSGRPNVSGVGWMLRMNITSSDNHKPGMHDAEAILQLNTDKGSKIVELSRGELVEFYMMLQKVQKSLDILLESKQESPSDISLLTQTITVLVAVFHVIRKLANMGRKL
uniref:COMM domain-containing protein n=1 Tax=Setaria digitata TaxID=48799 RepID=A0A915Q1S9_9BILA